IASCHAVTARAKACHSSTNSTNHMHHNYRRTTLTGLRPCPTSMYKYAKNAHKNLAHLHQVLYFISRSAVVTVFRRPDQACEPALGGPIIRALTSLTRPKSGHLRSAGP